LFSYEKIKFKKILSKDLKKIFIWRNHIFIRSKMLNQKKISYKEHLSWYKNLLRSNTQKSYIIYYKDVPIGVASIKEIDPINKTCTWGFYIANKAFRYLALLIEIKFITLIFKNNKIEKIWGETLSSNKRILKIHKYLGFTINGIKKYIKVNNKLQDVILTSIFKKDWSILKKILLKLQLNKKNEKKRFRNF
jgi:UDP-4-amino-4,6-dideoxy-N-acetyl-beta-L-altrosamine N-acetyltransferase